MAVKDNKVRGRKGRLLIGLKWKNDVVVCDICEDPVHIAFFHDEPVTFCPNCKQMFGYPYLG